MEFRLGTEQPSADPVVFVPAGVEHETWFREDTEVVDLFAPPRRLPGRRQAPLYERRLSHGEA